MYHAAFESDTDMQRWDSGCWIRYKLFEQVLEETPAASLLGYDVRELLCIAEAMRRHGFTPDELHAIAGNMQAAFDRIYDMMQKAHQEALNMVLSHYKPEA
jgi:hypothetical protein